MTIGQWFSFSGRIGRKTFWLGYVLPLLVASIVASVLDAALGLAPSPMADAVPADATQVGPVSGVVSLLSIWPMLAGSIKRLHDRDRSGWWIGGFYLVERGGRRIGLRDPGDGDGRDVPAPGQAGDRGAMCRACCS